MGREQRTIVGSVGNSRDGMVDVKLGYGRGYGMGCKIELRHDGWSASSHLDAASLVRLERLVGAALEAVTAHNRQDLEALREKFADYVMDDEFFAELMPRPAARSALSPESNPEGQ